MSNTLRYIWENDYDDQVVYELPKRSIVTTPKKMALKEIKFADDIMAKVVSRIMVHIEQNHQIAICGDYDVDGISATMIMLRTFEQLGHPCLFEIPNRFTDGYGLNTSIVDRLIQKNVKLIITVDNGVSAHEAIAYAQEQGVDVIVTDHHQYNEFDAPACLFLHPQQDDTVPNEICGAAVAYLLAEALLSSQQWSVIQNECLIFAMLATIADMMPLDIEFNRTITFLGYQLLKENMPVWLQEFKQQLRLEELTSDTLSFQIIPILNAVGRLDDANAVIHLLLANDAIVRQETIAKFIALNDERKQLSVDIVDEVLASYNHKHEIGFLVFANPSWHQGVLGIAAQRLMQKLQQPIVLLTAVHNQPDLLTGSARGFGDYNVKGCFDSVAQTLLKYGGHDYAGGLTLSANQFELFQQAIMAYNQTIQKAITTPKMTLMIDSWLKFVQLQDTFFNYQHKLEPFGMHNKKFVIGLHHVRILEVMELGKTQQHLKLLVEQDNKKYQIVAFSFYGLQELIAPYTYTDMVIECNLNYYNGQVQYQYQLLDIQIPEIVIFDYRTKKRQILDQTPQEEVYLLAEIPQGIDEITERVTQQSISKVILAYIDYEDCMPFAVEIGEKYFEYVYKFVHQNKKIQLDNEKIWQYMYERKIPKSIFLYIIRVFFELNFVIIEGTVCSINAEANRKELTMAPSYQKLQEWLKLREVLLMGTLENIYPYFNPRKEEK